MIQQVHFWVYTQRSESRNSSRYLYTHVHSFNSSWTVNFQMFKLVLEKAEEPEIKLPLKSKRVPEKHLFIDYAKAFDCVDHHKLENS